VEDKDQKKCTLQTTKFVGNLLLQVVFPTKFSHPGEGSAAPAAPPSADKPGIAENSLYRFLSATAGPHRPARRQEIGQAGRQ
jgi:hypothetical protein